MTLRFDSMEVRFVLGELSEEERVALEEKFFADDEFFHVLLEVEADLVDAYVRDEMTPAERQRFEASLDRFPGRSEKVRFANALKRILPLTQARRSPRWTRSLSLPLAAAVLLFGAATAWFAVQSIQLGRRRSALEAETTQLTRTVKDLERQTEELRSRIADLGLQARTSEVARGIASFVLAAGGTRGDSASNVLRIPETAEAISIEATLDGTRRESYRAAVQKPSGETIFSQKGLMPKRKKTGLVVGIVLAAEALPPGDYILVLSGEKAGGVETVAEFAFRVLRNP